MKFSMIRILSTVLIFISPQSGWGQSSLLLETRNSDFDQQTETWKDNYRITYAYDQEGNRIRKIMEDLTLCDVNDPDCEYLTDPQFTHSVESWVYDDRGQETLYLETQYGYAGVGFFCGRSGWDPSGCLPDQAGKR